MFSGRNRRTSRGACTSSGFPIPIRRLSGLAVRATAAILDNANCSTEPHESQGILGDAERAQFLEEREFVNRLSVFEPLGAEVSLDKVADRTLPELRAPATSGAVVDRATPFSRHQLETQHRCHRIDGR